MTLPYERENAVNSAYEFMVDLLDPKKTPRVPSPIRQRARRVLRHYPTPRELKYYMPHK